MSTPYLKATGRYYFTDECVFCKGRGRTPPTTPLAGWYVEYRYQDCHEVGGPYTKEEAVRNVTTGATDGSCMYTLIGPDGQVYVPEAPA